MQSESSLGMDGAKNKVGIFIRDKLDFSTLALTLEVVVHIWFGGWDEVLLVYLNVT